MAIGDIWEVGLELEGKNSRSTNVIHYRQTGTATEEYHEVALDLATAVMGLWISEGIQMYPDSVQAVCCTAKMIWPVRRELIVVYGLGTTGAIVGSEELPMGSAVLVAKFGHTAQQQGRMYLGLAASTLEEDGVLTNSGASTVEDYAKALLVDTVEGITTNGAWVGSILSKHVDPETQEPTMYDISRIEPRPSISSQRQRRNPHVPYAT